MLASSQFTAALRHDPAFLPAIFALADLYLDGGGKRNATKLLQNSFMLVPHVEIANRLLALWDDNDGNSIARLIKLIPKKPKPLQQTACHIVSDIAATKGLDGEARRLRHYMMPVWRPLAGNAVFVGRHEPCTAIAPHADGCRTGMAAGRKGNALLRDNPFAGDLFDDLPFSGLDLA